MAEHITIREAEGNWVVRAGGAVLAETSKALELRESGYPPVIYFPRSDIAMAFLDASDHTTHSAHIGDAGFFSIVTRSKTLANTAWSYESPLNGAAEIKDYIAFETGTDEVAVERV